MKKIRIGHIGTAHDHSPGMMGCIRKYPDVFEVVGIVEPDEARREAAKRSSVYAGLNWITEEQLFNAGVDAVELEGFELDNVTAARRCIAAGAHVHIDKPAGEDLDEFTALLREAKAKSLTVQLSYMYRYNPAVMDCLRRVRDGSMGEVYEVDAIMDTCHMPDKRSWLGHFKAGIMFFLGCHMVDLVYMMQGMPERVEPFNLSTGFDGVKAIDHSFAALVYKNGISTVRSTSTEVNGFGRRQLVVCGSKGTYEIKPLENPTRAYYANDARAEMTYRSLISEIELPVPAVAGRYDAMMLDFAAMVRGEKENPFDYRYEYDVHRLLLACCGEAVDLKENIVL